MLGCGVDYWRHRSTSLLWRPGLHCCRGAEARRWLEVVEQQTGAIAELRVEVEGGRRRQARLEEAAAAAQGEAAAARQDAEALLTQLQAAEAAAAAAEGAPGACCSSWPAPCA